MEKKNLSVMWLGLRGFPNVQGGVETHAQHICPLLVKCGCDVTVIVRSTYQRNDVGNAWNGVRFKSLWAPRSRHLEAFVHSFLGVLYAAIKRPDVLHIQAIGPSLVTPLARLLGLRVVVTHHGPDYHRQKWGCLARAALKLGEHFGARYSHSHIVISEVIHKLVRDKHGVESSLIPNGVNLPVMPETTAVLEKFKLMPGCYVLLVSRLVPEKRHHDLIAAFNGAGISGWKLVLVGGADHADPYARSVMKAAENNPDVVCTGFQTGTDLQELYGHAGMFVLPSSHEGLPIAILEALSYGLPVIASDIPANREVACSEIRYFPLGDVDALSKNLKILSCLEPESSRRERLRQFVSVRYNWSDIARKTYDVYSTEVEDVMPPRVAVSRIEAMPAHY